MIVTSELLRQVAWLEHGFGTRLSKLDQSTMASARQIHSDVILRADASGLAGEGDALVTSTSGVAVSIRTADCYPILLADTKRKAVAAVHAGWRGTAAAIVKKALDRLRAEYGTDMRDVLAVTGPGIGACCYEVGEEVARQFGRRGPGHLDLAAVNRRQLLEAGVPGERIDAVGACTYCEAGTYYSFRREKELAGRMISYIKII
jgi:polyphenol oxidase